MPSSQKRSALVAAALLFGASAFVPSAPRAVAPKAAAAPRTAALAATVAPVEGIDTRAGMAAAVKPAPATKEWEVHKFGGASLADAGLYRTVGDLLIQEAMGKQSDGAVPTMAIVSAMGGMTDLLVKVVDSALVDIDQAKVDLDAAVERQLETLNELAPPEIVAPIERRIRDDAADVLSLVRSLTLIKSVPAVTMEVVTGFGEIWSAQTLHAYLQTQGVPCDWVDAREILVVKSDSAGLGEKGSTSTTGVVPLWGETSKRMAAWWTKWGQPFEKLDYNEKSPILVCTGFVATSKDGVPTTLKRSGSDYSATIFAKLLGASRVTMWKNTNGVYTADPRRVPEAFPIESLKYDEAMELAYFGAQVLHPSAMLPCIDDNIPVYVRNIFNPSFEGTVIEGRSDTLAASWGKVEDDEDAALIKGITSIDDASLLTLEGASLAGGASEVGEKVLAAMSNAKVSVLMITQASSESSVTIAVPANQGELAIRAVEGAFELELARSTVGSVSLLEDMSIVAIVGEGMAKRPGASSTFMSALAGAGVNIGMIAQGSSERQIAVAVPKDAATRALRAAHAAFTLGEKATSVAVLGASGALGAQLLKQLKAQQETLETELKTEYKVIAVANSAKMTLATADQTAGLLGELGAGVEPMLGDDDVDLDAFSAFVEADVNPQRVIIDATASEDIAARYEGWIEAGISVVSPSKLVASGPAGRRAACLKAAKLNRGATWQYESSVGAALPVLTTLQDLLATGDKVTEIRGCLSGTMAYTLRNHQEDKAFSASLAEAYAAGFTEPDVREDLSGVDMARKVVILARELGLDVDVADVDVESIIPAEMVDKTYVADPAGKAAAVFADLKAMGVDAAMDERLAAAKADGDVLRYTFIIDAVAKTCAIKLLPTGPKESLFRLKENENLVSFTTARYATAPLIMKGSAAGAELAASGIFADLLRLSRTFG